MTPYALLLVRPTDTDLTIRQRFHVLSRQQHPDRDGGNGEPGALWFQLTEAYSQIKTSGLRAVWARRQAVRARGCPACYGAGVAGTTSLGGRVRLCAECGGEGVTNGLVYNRRRR